MNDAWFKHFTNHLIANPHSRTRSRSAIIRIKSTNLHIHYTEYGFNLPPEIRIVEILSLLKLEKSSLLIICYQMKLAISSNLEKQVALNSAEPTKMKMYNVIIYLDFFVTQNQQHVCSEGGIIKAFIRSDFLPEETKRRKGICSISTYWEIVSLIFR